MKLISRLAIDLSEPIQDARLELATETIEVGGRFESDTGDSSNLGAHVLDTRIAIESGCDQQHRAR